MTTAFGQHWFQDSTLDVRFKTPARPGDTITVNGKIGSIEKYGNHLLIRCEVVCSNQNGEHVILGETQVRIKQNDSSC